MTRQRQRQLHKKAVMGIETLIIFIAMILVAAVAAGVLLKTTGILQSRALAVGNEAIGRTATGMEIISISANANVSQNNFNEIATLVRLQAGSYDLSFLTMAFQIYTLEYSHQADIMHTLSSTYYNRSITFIDNDSWTNIGNIDIDVDDQENDYARLVYNISGNIDGLTINLSSGSLFNMSLGDDIENSTLSILDVPVKQFQGATYAPQYGFFTYTGNASADDYINTTGSGGFATFSNAPSDNDCTFDNLIPNNKFCIKTKIGDTDTILEDGELIEIRYKVTTEGTIEGDSNLDMRYIPKTGTIIDVAVYVPDVIQRNVVNLWP